MIEATANVEVNYRQYYILDRASPGGDLVTPDPSTWAPSPSGEITIFEGGAAVFTGTYLGPVRVTVGVHSTEPRPRAGWEHVVSAMIVVKVGETHIEHWEWEDERPGLPNLTPFGPGSYDLRIHAAGRAASAAADVVTGEPLEHHLIDVWPV